MPALIAVASANTTRQTDLFGDAFFCQTVSYFTPYLDVQYTILDFGACGSQISEALDQLLAANFAFNTVQLDVIFETYRRYYMLLNALDQQETAQVNLQNATTVQKAIRRRKRAATLLKGRLRTEARLSVGHCNKA